jgi:hypothetical protein
MSLTLGKSFNRNYSIRLPFMDGFFNIGIFFNNKSPFLLFNIDPDFPVTKEINNYKINMFKNVESSSFSETFLNLHNYKSNSLDIINQFKEIKNEFVNDVAFILNENIILSKVVIQDKELYDQIIIYGLTLTSYSNEFIFILTERQNIVTKLKKKLVRTSALQIATSNSLSIIDEYRHCFKESKEIYTVVDNSDKIIKLEDS